MIQPTLTAFIDQPQIGTVQSRLDTLTDAAVTRNYFRRMHEMQTKDAGPLTKLVVWITGGVGQR